ncbi:MAG: UvrD-helicase domain-containing protein [Nanoarchaeota archaeon]
MEELDYLYVLKALDEIPFGVGKKLLMDFLKGEEKNESIKRNKLNLLANFGSMAYEDHEINLMIDNLILNNMIKLASVSGNKFWKVMELSPKGIAEIKDPSLYKRKLSFSFKQKETIITQKERELFSSFGDILAKFNDKQKKSIINNKKHILCIAGAGSGKTTVLTKRIEFMVKYRSVDPTKILAITFTRKARQEMMKRLDHVEGVKIETFNSFCEKILNQYNDMIYDLPVKVATYRDKVIMMNKALSSLNLDMERALNIYFTFAQKRGKTNEELANIFMNDCFFIRDYFKSKNKPIRESSFEALPEHEKSIKMVIGISIYIENYMKRYGLRDFTDQLIDTISLFEKQKDIMPKFDHVLIDEYQDVNSTQIKLIDLLSPENIFCVGDPRQSIYGWRGSDIRHILKFEDKYPDCDIITLTKNYRSTKHIVALINESIKTMGLPDLDTSLAGNKDIKLLKFDSEDAEFQFITQMIVASQLPRSEIFILARTNRQLNDLSNILKLNRIDHVVRSDEIKRTKLAGKDDVTLATIHAIKGLESKMVFVIGCTNISFPCKGSEHPVIDMVKVEEYDKEEEERRLFYVAMSRARDTLYLTYSGKPTYFLTDGMLKMIDETKIELKPKKKYRPNMKKSGDIVSRLKEWRREISNQISIPSYMVMHDRTLIDIAQKMPLTNEDLEEIHGLGPTKIMKYGKEILDIVQS